MRYRKPINITVYKPHLCATVDGLTKPDMFLHLGTSVPVLACNALRVSIDAGLTCGEVAEGLDGIHCAALVRIDPVETCKRTDTPHCLAGQKLKVLHVLHICL